MLKLPRQHTKDKKANIIISKYLNGNILGMVRDKVIDYEGVQGRKAAEDDPAFQEEISYFFPEGYPKEKMGKVFLGLQALLESEYEFVPELIMEYVMYQLIEERIQISDDLGTETLEPISDGRDYVIGVLKKEYPDGNDEKEATISWQEKLARLEDLHYYDDIYFWDMDYLLLDSFTESELKDNPASKFLGIDNLEERNKKFGLPPEWLK